jgi:transcription elongation GreA/GreB family factor
MKSLRDTTGLFNAPRNQAEADERERKYQEKLENYKIIKKKLQNQGKIPKNW